MKARKITAIILSAALFMSITVAGCSKSSSKKDNDKKDKDETEAPKIEIEVEEPTHEEVDIVVTQPSQITEAVVETAAPTEAAPAFDASSFSNARIKSNAERCVAEGYTCTPLDYSDVEGLNNLTGSIDEGFTAVKVDEEGNTITEAYYFSYDQSVVVNMMNTWVSTYDVDGTCTPEFRGDNEHDNYHAVINNNNGTHDINVINGLYMRTSTFYAQ